MEQDWFTPQEAAAKLNAKLAGSTFRRYADRLGISFHKIGRQRYYTAEAIEQVKRGTKQCPEGGQDHDSGGARDNGQSCGPKTGGHASVAQARLAAQKLKKSSQTGYRNGGSDRKASVVHLNI